MSFKKASNDAKKFFGKKGFDDKEKGDWPPKKGKGFPSKKRAKKGC